jgi:hypothetical protein
MSGLVGAGERAARADLDREVALRGPRLVADVCLGTPAACCAGAQCAGLHRCLVLCAGCSWALKRFRAALDHMSTDARPAWTRSSTRNCRAIMPSAGCEWDRLVCVRCSQPPFAGDAQDAALVSGAIGILRKGIAAEPFHLTLINLGALASPSVNPFQCATALQAIP